MKEFDELLETIKTLRAPGGCPWDRDQTALSMRRDLMEECCEAIDAITQNDVPHVKEELGDLIFNALIMGYLYQQNGDFTINDILSEVNAKLIRRHPHVFKNSEGASEMKEKPVDSAAVLNQWDKIKENVEGRKGESILDEVPQGFPPLLKAYKMLKKAGKKHFEWQNLDEVLAKVEEELAEVKEAQKAVEQHKKSPDDKPHTVSGGNSELDKAQLHLEEELGDLLMSIVNYGRWNGIDCELAMNRANSKFYKRFTYIEKEMGKKNIPMDKGHQDIMIKLWNEAKTSV